MNEHLIKQGFKLNDLVSFDLTFPTEINGTIWRIIDGNDELAVISPAFILARELTQIEAQIAVSVRWYRLAKFNVVSLAAAHWRLGLFINSEVVKLST